MSGWVPSWIKNFAVKKIFFDSLYYRVRDNKNQQWWEDIVAPVKTWMINLIFNKKAEIKMS